MAFNNAPSIATGGLAFAYDMANPKSWKGMPTSNLIVTAPYALGIYAYASGPVVTSSNRLNQETGNVNRYTITSATNTARARILPSLAVGQTYTFSAMLRYNGANTSSPGWTFDAGKGNPESGGANTLTNVSQTVSLIGQGWYYCTFTFTVAASPTGAAILTYGVSTGTDTAYLNQTFDSYNEQFEIGVGSPYVNGTRTTSTSIYDLTNKSTLVANSLTNTGDGGFKFYGANYITATFPQINLYNLNMWLYNDYVIPGTDTAIGGVITSYQTMISFNQQATQGINLGGWTSSATNEAVHIWSNTSTAAGYTGMTYIRDAIPIGWHNFQFNWNGTAYDIWVDGIKKTTYAHTLGNAPLAPISSATIGGYTGSSYYYVGKLPVVTMYSTQLTDDQVLQNFNALRGRFGI